MNRPFLYLPRHEVLHFKNEIELLKEQIFNIRNIKYYIKNNGIPSIGCFDYPMTLFGFPCNYCNKLYDPNQDHQKQYAIEFLNDFIVGDWFNEIFIIDFQDYEIFFIFIFGIFLKN